MGSKLVRKNRALMKLQSRDKEVEGLSTDPTEPESVQRPGRYRLVSKDGHFVILFANSVHHARHRWNEFYPNVSVGGVIITFLC